MGEWKDCTISDIGTVVGGATPSTKRAENYVGGTIAWITPKDLSDFRGRYISHGERNITKLGLNSCSAQLLPPNTVLFSSRAPIGYVAIAENEVCTNQGFKSVVPNSNTDPLFLYYLLKNNKNTIENMGSGTTFKEVSGNIMKHINVHVPVQLEEQKKIGYVLGILDDKIELNERINQNLTQQVVTLWKHLLESTTYSYATIADIAEKVAMGPFGSNIKVSTFVPSGIPIISGNHLRGYFLEEDKYNFITEEHAEKLKNSNVFSHDIIFTHAGNIGQVAMIPENSKFSRYVLSQRQFYLRCDVTKVVPEYVLFFFHSAQGQHELLSFANQTGVPSIAQPATNLKKIQLPLPSLSEQKHWYEYVKPLLDLYLNNRKECEMLTFTRDTLLPRLMSGELDISALDV